ncbi:hypothetical protein GXM_03902 [Nostoc sphaeroides CCNUC1]|uniref:Uncharacterized protein n=1 Tax=Nostoc sphaeroides CCNUC1 TaxID=2653204 RepID=A0A5P8W1E9_9NOSO|nr:hypothetical protein GXM_03902 [Nostoc sphaeroides CCNUC1]
MNIRETPTKSEIFGVGFRSSTQSTEKELLKLRLVHVG